MFVIVEEDITSHQSANSSHPNVRIAKKWDILRKCASSSMVQSQHIILKRNQLLHPKLKRTLILIPCLFTMTRGNVITEDVLINAHPIKMEVDTGAALSLVSSETYHNIAQTNEIELLQEATVKLRTYMGECINIIFQCCMENLLRILLYT